MPVWLWNASVQFYAIMAEFKYLQQRYCMACKAWNVYLLALCRKSLLTTDLKVCLVSKYLEIFPIMYHLLISDLSPLWAEKICCVISYFCFFNLLKFVLWPKIWSVLVNISCSLEMSVYPIVLGCSVLYMSDSLFLCPYWYSTYDFCWLLREEYWSLYLQLHLYPFLLSVPSVFASCFSKPYG